MPPATVSPVGAPDHRLDHDLVYVDGSWVASTGTGVIEVVDPSTEQVIGSIPEGTAADVDVAVRAAREAFRSWGVSTPAERKPFLKAILEGMIARKEEIGEIISLELGMPRFYSTLIQASLPIESMTTAIALLHSFPWEERIGGSLVVREPIGVVGAITPWNFPLHQILCKVAPALAAGCTVVLKPSEVAPLNAFLFAEICHEAGLPAGVFNMVTGTGPVVGEAIASHPDIDMVSFTGSTGAGKRVTELAAVTVKRVALELGGKSANVILDDADLAACIPPGVQFGCFLNSGQTCSALTRMLVPRSLQDRVVELAVAKAESLSVGPADAGTDLGPLVSKVQQDRVRAYIQSGIDEGARLVTGGTAMPDGVETGFFVQPTVFADVTPSMTIAQEEIFGPVLVIMPYDSEDEAVDIANGTIYGLGGGVQSADPDRALAMARRLRTGRVDINGAMHNIAAPFGGYKQSGNGRENGRYGMEEFLEVKSFQLPGDM